MLFRSSVNIFMPSTSNDEVKHINPYISKSIAYINNNLKNKITINDVCKYINLSKFYFSRIFKKEVLEKFDEIPFGYGVEVGMTIDILKYGYRIKEVLVNMTHSETGRDLQGFIHRGKQYYHIKKVLRQKKKEWR